MLDQTPTLPGSLITLVPNTPAHDAALFAATPLDTFAYFLSAPRAWTLEAFAEYMRSHRENPNSRVFTVVRNAEPSPSPSSASPSATAPAVLGSTAYMDIDEKNRCVEIGATWYTPSVRGGHSAPGSVNAECKLLLLEHAFNALGCVRVTLKCDQRNLRSQRAIASLGATHEGVLRNHRITSTGFVRNTVMYSVVPEDMPTIRARLRDRIGT